MKPAPFYATPPQVRVGDILLDPFYPADEPHWVEVKRAYRTDFREGLRELEVQDACGNEYEVYLSLGSTVQISRDPTPDR